jgi:hypothetical protein
MWFMSYAGMKAAFVICYDHCQATIFSEHDASPDCDRTASCITETPLFRRNGRTYRLSSDAYSGPSCSVVLTPVAGRNRVVDWAVAFASLRTRRSRRGDTAKVVDGPWCERSVPRLWRGSLWPAYCPALPQD